MRSTRNLLRSHEIEGKVIYVLGVVLLVQFLYPITENGSVALLMLYQVVYASLIFVGIFVTRNNPSLVRFLSVVGAVWIVASFIFSFNQAVVWASVLGYICYVVFQSTVTWMLARYVLEAQSITRDVLYAAIAIYLLLGAIFVPIYGLIDTLTYEFSGGNTHAFVGGVISSDGAVFAWQDFIYYSYVTLTTLGYGDILPVTMLAKAAVSLEAIIGVMYLTIIMARLVSLYSSDFNRISTD